MMRNFVVGGLMAVLLVDLKSGAPVLVYCRAFNVAFGNATLLSSR